MINYFRRMSLGKRLDDVFDRPAKHRKQMFFIFLALALFGLVCGCGILWICAETFPVYQGVLNKGESQVYDGDTLKDVRISIFSHETKLPREPTEIWPGIWLTRGGIEVETDVRIAGIDTPERRPSTKNADGTKRSQASRAKEKAAALVARHVLVDLLSSNNYVFSVSEPELGKYAGRVVADVISGEIDVAAYLIDQGHAKKYDGGTKPFWDFGD